MKHKHYLRSEMHTMNDTVMNFHSNICNSTSSYSILNITGGINVFTLINTEIYNYIATRFVVVNNYFSQNTDSII